MWGQWELGGIPETKTIFKWLWVTPWISKYLLNIISGSTSNSLWVTHWFLNDIVKYVFKLYKQ